jgi:hypothetical protein
VYHRQFQQGLNLGSLTAFTTTFIPSLNDRKNTQFEALKWKFRKSENKSLLLAIRLTLWQAHGQAPSYSQRVYEKSDIMFVSKNIVRISMHIRANEALALSSLVSQIMRSRAKNNILNKECKTVSERNRNTQGKQHLGVCAM